MNNFDKWFAKSLVILAMLAFFMPMFFLLNTISSLSLWVFIALIFGCNIIYDAVKRVLASHIYIIKDWLQIIKFAWAGLALLALSFVGIYIDIFVFKYVGIGLIWFPCFFTGMYFMAKSETKFKEAEKQLTSR